MSDVGYLSAGFRHTCCIWTDHWTAVPCRETAARSCAGAKLEGV